MNKSYNNVGGCMKIKIIDENNFIVFLNKYVYKDIDLTSKRDLEIKLKDLFQKLNNYYNVKVYGYYNVSIFIDNNYGFILEMEKEDIDYMDYQDDQIDMRIVVINNTFLYLLDDILINNVDGAIYKYKDKFYLKLNHDINNIEMGKLLENSNIIYNKTNDIIKYGTLLKMDEFVI